MTEREYVEAIEAVAPPLGERASDDVVALARRAVQQFPVSEDLLYMLAGVLRLWGEVGCTDHLEEVFDLYRRVAALDPSSPIPHEEIGSMLDTFRSDFTLAEVCFRRALGLGATENGYAGLARVLAQQDKRAEALALLHPDSCPHGSNAEVIEMRGEIERGVWSPYEGE